MWCSFPQSILTCLTNGMTRDQQLVYCKCCIHRQMDFKKGLCCGITNELADFENTCINFSRDQEETARIQNEIDVEFATYDKLAKVSDKFERNPIFNALKIIFAIVTIISAIIAFS
jgi:hypothetical protein